MTEYASLIVPVTAPSTDDGEHGFVKLEVGPVVNPHVNYLTSAQAVGYLSTWMFGTPPPLENCSGGLLELTIYAYPSRPGLAFRTGTSRGTLVLEGVEPYERVEIRQVEYETTIDSGGLPGEQVSAIWQGETYDYFGDVMAPPIVRPDGDTVDLGREAYGALVITRSGTRYVYRLTVQPEIQEDENSFQAVVYAVWAGGVSGLPVTAADGVIDDQCNSRASGQTGNTGDLQPGEEDEDPEEYIEGENSDCMVNFCTEIMPPGLGGIMIERAHKTCDDE